MYHHFHPLKINQLCLDQLTRGYPCPLKLIVPTYRGMHPVRSCSGKIARMPGQNIDFLEGTGWNRLVYNYIPIRDKDTSFPKSAGTICNVPGAPGMPTTPYHRRSRAQNNKKDYRNAIVGMLGPDRAVRIPPANRNDPIGMELHSRVSAESVSSCRWARLEGSLLGMLVLLSISSAGPRSPSRGRFRGHGLVQICDCSIPVGSVYGLEYNLTWILGLKLMWI